MYLSLASKLEFPIEFYSVVFRPVELIFLDIGDIEHSICEVI